MSQKKLFLLFIVISTVSFLLHHGGHLSWVMDVSHLGCPSLCCPRPSSSSRSKHTNVVFLKTHKTASTTMQNLLFRFAERHNLTVALPVQSCGHQFCYPAPFSARFVHPHTLPAAVVTNHMRFGRAELRRMMPNDTAYITILREPSAMFESLFGYYNQNCASFRRVPNGSLEAFLDEPWRYYRPGERDSMYARNTLTFDLGGDKDRPPSDEAYARAFVAEVDHAFALVMIAEHFDESLVLLRHLMGWDLEDLLYVKLNMRTPGSKRGLSPALPAKIRSWNWLDARLYRHFNATLWRRLAALGPACVAREVRLLRLAKDRLVRGCFGGGPAQLRSSSQIKNKDLRPWQPSAKVDIVGYELPVANSSGRGGSAQPSDLCLKLVMPELQYTRVLLRAQSSRYRRGYPARPPQWAPLRTALPKQHQSGSGDIRVGGEKQPPPPPGQASQQGVPAPVLAATAHSASPGTLARNTRLGSRASQKQMP